MAYDPNEPVTYTLAYNLLGGRQRDEAEKERQRLRDLDHLRRTLQTRQDVANQEAERQARLTGEAMIAQQPSSTVTGQKQEGPVLQGPSFDLGLTGDPAPPRSIAESVFAQSGQPVPFHPDRAERAGQGSFDSTSPGATVRDPFPTASPYDRSGGYAANAPPDAIPESLRRPDSIEAAPSSYRPGGERESVPGQPLAQLLAQNPAAGSAYLGNRKVVDDAQTADTEAVGRKATQDYIRARKQGATADEAYAQYGDAMEASETGRKFLTSIGARAKDVEATAKVKRENQQAQDTQAFIKRRVEQLRKSDDPDDRILADALEAHAADPKLAEEIRKVREDQTKRKENELKRAELKKPTIVDGVAYDISEDAVGTRTMTPIAGQTGKAWYHGKNAEELLAISRDQTVPPERRQEARALYQQALQDKKDVNAAMVPKPTAQTEKVAAEHYNMLLGLDDVAKIAKEHPEYISGWTSLKWAAAYDSPDYAKGVASTLAQIPPGYAAFRAKLDPFTANRLNELAGSALTVGEIKRYAAFLPSPYQPPERFLANVQASRELLSAAMKFHEVRAAGGTIPEAQAAARAAIKAVADGYAKQYGEPPPPRAKQATTSREAARNLGIPVTNQDAGQ